MNRKRQYLVEAFPEFYPLTAEERSEGWHFCPDWDYMLVGPDTPEQDCCACFTIYTKEEDE